eukprot:1159862-Pelagomonas_calceolata.AAC.4
MKTSLTTTQLNSASPQHPCAQTSTWRVLAQAIIEHLWPCHYTLIRLIWASVESTIDPQQAQGTIDTIRGVTPTL